MVDIAKYMEVTGLLLRLGQENFYSGAKMDQTSSRCSFLLHLNTRKKLEIACQNGHEFVTYQHKKGRQDRFPDSNICEIFILGFHSLS